MSTDPVLAAIASLRTDLLDAIETRFGALRADVVHLRADVDHLRTDVDHLRTDMERLRADMERLRGYVVEKFQAIEDKLNLIRDDVSVTMNSANTSFDRTQAARRESDNLGSMVHTMMRQVQRLRTDLDDLRGKGQGA